MLGSAILTSWMSDFLILPPILPFCRFFFNLLRRQKKNPAVPKAMRTTGTVIPIIMGIEAELFDFAVGVGVEDGVNTTVVERDDEELGGLLPVEMGGAVRLEEVVGLVDIVKIGAVGAQRELRGERDVVDEERVGVVDGSPKLGSRVLVPGSFKISDIVVAVLQPTCQLAAS